MVHCLRPDNALTVCGKNPDSLPPQDRCVSIRHPDVLTIDCSGCLPVPGTILGAQSASRITDRDRNRWADEMEAEGLFDDQELGPG